MSAQQVSPLLRSSLWLEVRWAGKVRVFELLASGERAIVVGSLLSADVRIPVRSVCPLHFHFEREQGDVWLVPAYGTDVRVNAARLAGPLCMRSLAVVEFAGMRLDAIVHERQPMFDETLTDSVLPLPKPGRSYLRALPEPTAVTGVLPGSSNGAVARE